MTNLRLEVVLSLCFLLTVPFHQGTAQPAHSASAGVVLVTATVDGHPGRFLIDTGTERSCLDAEFARQLTGESSFIDDIQGPYKDGRAHGILIRDFGVGSYHLQNLAMLSTELTSSFSRGGVALDGILGTDVLRRFSVTLDFASGSAEFRTDAPTDVRAKVVSLTHVDTLYLASVNVQGTAINLLLDTGANFTSISSAAWARITAHWQPKVTLDGVRSTGGSEDSQFVLVPALAIGSSFSSDVPLRIQPKTEHGLFSDIAFTGLLGSDVLRQFLVTLDLANNRMYLAPDPTSHVDRYLFSTIGIQFAKAADGLFTILAVWTPSPAASSGLKIGDRILEVNHVDARRMSLEDLSREVHGPPGTQVNLVIESAGHPRRVPLAITCLLCPVDPASKRTLKGHTRRTSNVERH